MVVVVNCISLELFSLLGVCRQRLCKKPQEEITDDSVTHLDIVHPQTNELDGKKAHNSSINIIIKTYRCNLEWLQDVVWLIYENDRECQEAH